MTFLISSTLLLMISFVMRKYKMAATALLAVLIIAFPFIPLNFGQPQKAPETINIETAEAEDMKDPKKYLASFYSTEADRVTMFKQPTAGDTPFDIVILHLCSLSWQDLKEIGITQEDPFFKQFDYLFTNFNTVTGYSGPAVIRLLRASCGQASHDDLYKKDGPNKICLLFENLASVGYEDYVSMDHDGKYGDYIKQAKSNGLNNAKFISQDGLQPEAVFFDGKSPIFGEFAMLKKWNDTRQESKSPRAALYFNSVLMHAGSHWVDEKNYLKRDKIDQFKDVTSVVFTDIKKFFKLLETSKRNTVVIFVPEHGRALNGTAFQVADLRDIPLPKITKVPVGIKFFGPKFEGVKTQQHVIEKPTSYLALSWLLSKYIEHSPFGSAAESADDLILKMPKTEYVSEHEGRIIIERGGNYLFYGKDKQWITLTADQLK